MNFLPPPPPPPTHVTYQPTPVVLNPGFVTPPPPPQPVPVTSTAPVKQTPSPKRINVRQKGQRGEREVVHLLQEIVNKVHRDRGTMSEAPTIQRNALQAHLGGEDLTGLEGFSVEVKFQECEFNPAWWRQCLSQAEASGGVPILFWRASKQKWKVRMRVYVNTPGDRDQIEMDCDVTVDDFVEWFGNAYAEQVDNEQL